MYADLFRMAWASIASHALRSGLTVLGVVVGVASVLAISSLGEGLQAKVERELKSLTGVTVFVTAEQRQGADGRAVALAASDAKTIAAEIFETRAVTPIASAKVPVGFNGVSAYAEVVGTSASYFAAMTLKLRRGRPIDADDEATGRPVCVIGDRIREKLFGAAMPLGARLHVDRASCEVVGVLRRPAGFNVGDQGDQVVMPLRAYLARIAGSDQLQMLAVALPRGVSVRQVSRRIVAALAERHKLSAAAPVAFRTTSSEEAIGKIHDALSVTTLVLGTIASISLIVGGVGIMNMMLVSVTERTREIGIRLANGAMPRDILAQFLVEATMLSLLGGMLGFVLGCLLSWALGSAIDVPFVIGARSAAITLGASVSVGIAFGYVPALRAAGLDPIQALRHD
jgi:putative ABC transport system permease protein